MLEQGRYPLRKKRGVSRKSVAPLRTVCSANHVFVIAIDFQSATDRPVKPKVAEMVPYFPFQGCFPSWGYVDHCVTLHIVTRNACLSALFVESGPKHGVPSGGAATPWWPRSSHASRPACRRWPVPTERQTARLHHAIHPASPLPMLDALHRAANAGDFGGAKPRPPRPREAMCVVRTMWRTIARHWAACTSWCRDVTSRAGAAQDGAEVAQADQ